MEGWQERQKQEHRALAVMLYRYGMTFKIGKFDQDPMIYELFPLWDEDEIRQMQLDEIKSKMAKWSAQKIKK